jgi:uncharacterized protein (DUF885 family)
MKIDAAGLSLLLLASMAIQVAFAPATQAARASSAAGDLHVIEEAIERDQLESSFYARFRAGKPVSAFEDYSLTPIRREAVQFELWNAALDKIAPTTLSEIDRQTYRILQFEFSNGAGDEVEYWLTLDMTPYLAPLTLGTADRVMAAQPLVTPANVAAYLRLVEAYATMLNTLAVKVAAQKARGIYMPKAVLPVVRSTWKTLAAGTTILQPAEIRTAGLDTAVKKRLAADVDRLLKNRIDPAYASLIALIDADYEAKAPVAVGIGQYPGGKAVYLRQVRRSTTIETSPEELYLRGLAAVADISARMQAIRSQLGFTGTSREFYDMLSVDPRFIANDTGEVEATYWRYVHAIEPKVSSYFRTVPKAAYGVQRLPLAAEAGQTFGYYSPPTPAEPRGLYYYNGSNLSKRSLVNAGTLIYHELVPGHHFAIASQEENDALTLFRKHYSVGAFNEGWAEYAASLGIELNLYDTPETLYGRYVNEIFLAARLVVDTGMNYFGWPLEKARAYMHEVTSLSDVEIESESLRYSTNWPGQALAYRVGYEKLWELRHRAEKALRDRFDIRDFHAVVLAPGSRPMPVVEQDVDAYIAEKSKGG